MITNFFNNNRFRTALELHYEYLRLCYGESKLGNLNQLEGREKPSVLNFRPHLKQMTKFQLYKILVCLINT